MDKKALTSSKFGKWGWSIIAYSFLLYYFWAGLAVDGLNIYTTAFSATYGLDYNTILGYATPAGIIGVIGGIIAGRLIMKTGARKMAAVTLIATGIIYMLFGYLATTHISYLIFLSLFTFVSMAFGLIANTALMSNWFPRKKGIALGWSTMGAPFCTATFVAILSVLVGRFGIGNACLIIGIVVVVFGIVSFFWVKDYPEEVGAYPDNIPEGGEQLAAQLAEMRSYKSPFTVKVLLKDKDMWLMSLGFGMLWMVTVGIVSQFVPRMLSVGYDNPTALMMLTVAAIIGLFGSYFWGWLDQKTNTKLASLIYSASYIIALLLLIQGSQIACYIAIVFVGLGIGGLLNLMPSMVITVYGRHDFASANSLVSPIASLMQKFAFIIMAVLLAQSGGSYTLPYTVFIVIDIVGAALLMFVTKECKGKTGI
ncbi:MFS transporter [Ruminococcaceae bacterium OttesenSCG-928-D13]|nr:MFS transporter [Ruminococcaceae bacterium OttesenSCG-928-D13]